MPGRSLAKTRKRNKAAKAAKAAHARKMLQKKLGGDLSALQQAGLPFPESIITHNLTEPLLEIFKEEPQLEVSREEPFQDTPTAPSQPLAQTLLEPKPEPIDPIPEVSICCSLCLRPCTSDQVVELSADVASGRDKLALLLGPEFELEQGAICRPCWTLVETLVDFREGCLKAIAWRTQFSFGLDVAGDDWMSKENVEAMERIRKVVQEHVARIDMAEADARNTDGFGSNELVENFDHRDSAKELTENNSSTAFSCAKCHQSFETKIGMAIHFGRCMKSFEKKPVVAELHTCFICSVNFTKSHRLREHHNKHLGIKPYVCRKEKCKKRFHATYERIKHEQRCKGNNLLNTSMDQASPETSTMDTATEETPQKIYSCGKCPRKFDNKTGLVQHERKCTESAESPRLRRCPICSVEFLYSYHLEAHMNWHNDIKPFKCKNEDCDEYFYGSSERQRHTKKCDKHKPVCRLCELQLSSKEALKTHMETHPEEANCRTCGKMFKSKKSLITHQLVHLTELNYPCDECGKAFKTAHLLYMHRRVHTNERNFPCGVCGKAYKTSYALSVHRWHHVEEKPFSCTICGKGFIYKNSLSTHMERYHTKQD